MNDELNPRRYSHDEVSAILEKALQHQGGAGGITREELAETARELGIDPTRLEEAITDHEMNAGIEQAREQWKLRRKRKFFEHLRSYIIVNAILIGINVVSGDFFWAIFPLLGWGIGLAFDAAEAFFPSEEKVERGARRILAKQNYADAWKTIKHGARSFKREIPGFKQETRDPNNGEWRPTKNFRIDGRNGKIVIEKGDKRIEIG